MNDWRDMDSAPTGEDAPSVLVWNGKRVGEARASEDYSEWEGEGPFPYRWAWTHHSTCACYHSFMNPQPIKWQPMPEPPEPPETQRA